MSIREGYAAVLGDVVRSRAPIERAELQQHLADVLERANGRLRPADPFQITIGDEFQGLFTELQDAMEATLWVQAWMKPMYEVRFGIGWGRLATYDPDRSPFGQDGPAWWAARDALDEAHRLETRQGVPRGWRTVLRLPVAEAEVPGVAGEAGEAPFPGLPAPRSLRVDTEGLANGFLALRDHLLADLDEEDVEMLELLDDGAPQRRIAEHLGISQQAVSSRAHSRGIFALLAAQSHATSQGAVR